MQLFAIISKQDDGLTEEKRNYVKVFLSQQISDDLVDSYYELFESHLVETRKRTDRGDKQLTSVKDSVRILGICKRINKTLTQKQKIVVLVRLFELIRSDGIYSEQRIAIIDTASKVFKLTKEEYDAIENFVIQDDLSKLNRPEILIVTQKSEDVVAPAKLICSESLPGYLVILKVNSVNLYFLRYAGNALVNLNGLALNNKRIYLLASGSTIKPAHGKPIYYSDVATKYLEASNTVQLSFDAQNLEYRFLNGNLGLRDVTISEGPGNLVGIMGASGAGKTTLLNVLAGLEAPSGGQVLINGIDLYQKKELLEGIIGFVPQDDLLIEELTVFQNLYYNAKLCFRDLDEKGITELVEKVIHNLGLTDTRDLKVGNPMAKTISGGQRKRLNIGLELLREPSILFLDEPTSGLSSRDSENVMDLLRELTLKGKLIFVVIHQPSSEIYKMFDKVVLLDAGGYQIYYGNPVEAVTYFKTIDNQINSHVGECPTCGNVNPEMLFNILEARVVDELGQLTDKRKVSPRKWREFYLENFTLQPVEPVRENPPQNLQLPSWFRQIGIFFTRDILSKLSNRQYLLINLLEAPLLAFFLSFIIRYIQDPNSDQYFFRENENAPAYLFISIVVALFVGLTVSAEEIFRDRKILKREAFLNLSRSSYLLSKIGILFLLSAVQTFCFVFIGNSLLEIKGMYFDNWLVLFSISCFANLLGLNISSSFNSAVTIYILIPLLIIPQMILGGAMFDFEKLNRAIGGGVGNKVPFIAELMPSRWAYEAMVVNQYVQNEYEKPLYQFNKKESFCDYKQAYYIPKLLQIMGKVRQYQRNPQDSLRQEYEHNIWMLRREVEREMNIFGSQFEEFELLTPEKYNVQVGLAVDRYLNERKNFYSIAFNLNNDRKDNFIRAASDSMEANGDYSFVRLYNEHYNDYLGDVVKKGFSESKVIVYNGDVIQVSDPIYLDPEPALLDFRAHFFAPKKSFAYKTFNTLGFNCIVIWLFTLLLYVTLYFNALSRLMELPGKLQIKRSGNE